MLARDHFGIKPLFYARHRGRVVFASEIKAILQDETFPRDVDEQQMYEYLRFGLFDHNDGTFFRGIRQVPAAAFAVIEGGTISETVYWTPRLSEDGDASPEAFRAVFERAVQRRLVADVPVGICLSGGLDSSSICTVMAQQLRDHVPDTESLGDRLKTFSAVFPGDRIDESAYIDSVLDVTGADNSAVQPTDQDFIRELEAWVWHMEEPMVSSAPFAMWMVMRLARRQVTVTLDGQAGDELLAGYDHYPYVLLRQLLRERRYAEFAREAWLLRDIVEPAGAPAPARARSARRRRGHARTVVLRAGASRPADDRVADDLKRRLLQDFRVYSLPPLLRYEDRASMAHSLEARLPFLDQELVDYILTLPRTRDHPQRLDSRDRPSGAARRPAPKGRGPPQEDRFHHARVPLVSPSARGAAEPHALAVVPRAPLLEGRRRRRELPSRVRRRDRGVDVLLARGQRRGLAARLHRRRDARARQGQLRGRIRPPRRSRDGDARWPAARRCSTERASTGDAICSSRTGAGSGRASRCARR